ncbi:MAG TPA: hypothetical protein VNC50_15150, partial [Planctomycetia bacterium]|nr:hypothetical protein [Planctomycetia bacterium]
MSMTPAQQESVNSLLRILGAAGLAGAGARAGFGVLRNANRSYEPPEIPKPLIVDMPYAAREAPPATTIPIPRKTKELKPDTGMAFAPEKAAADPASYTPDFGKLLGGGPQTTSVDGQAVVPPGAPATPFGGANFQSMRTLPSNIGNTPITPSFANPMTAYRTQAGGRVPHGPFETVAQPARFTVGDAVKMSPLPIGRALGAVNKLDSVGNAYSKLTEPTGNMLGRMTTAVKSNADKSAGLWDQLKSILPDAVPFGGHPNATSPMEVPAFGAAVPAAAGVGGIGGFMLADKILRAAEHRGARKDVDAAQEEYRNAILNRITKTQTGKVAADLVKMASDQTPDDVDLKRAKAALDAAF